MQKEHASQESEVEDENSDDDAANETGTIEKSTSRVLAASMMPAKSMINHIKYIDNQLSPITEESISEIADSSKANKSNEDNVQKVVKSQSNNNYAILIIIVILLICFALGYKKFK